MIDDKYLLHEYSSEDDVTIHMYMQVKYGY